MASETGSSATLNIGAAAGDAAVAPGTLDTSQISIGDGDATIVFNHTGGHHIFAPTIIGNGQIDLFAGTTEIDNAPGFTGDTSVGDGSTLIANGTLGGTLGVAAGGRLQGSGTVGTTSVSGTIAPGNSIGTLSVSGAYTQTPGSTYEVQIDSAGNSDRIQVSGAATLNGGTVEVLPYPDYEADTPYTILTASSGVTGAFADVYWGGSSLFLSPSLSYDPNTVYLTVAETASFASVGLTPNERAAAAGADSLGPGNELWDTIAGLGTADEARAAFDAIAGEAYASVKSVLIDDSRFPREAASRRIAEAFGASSAHTLPVLAYGEGGPKVAEATVPGFAMWGQAYGSWAHYDSDGNAAEVDRSLGGLIVGADMPLADNWRAGLMAAYEHTSLDIERAHHRPLPTPLRWVPMAAAGSTTCS